MRRVTLAMVLPCLWNRGVVEQKILLSTPQQAFPAMLGQIK